MLSHPVLLLFFSFFAALLTSSVVMGVFNFWGIISGGGLDRISPRLTAALVAVSVLSQI